MTTIEKAKGQSMRVLNWIAAGFCVTIGVALGAAFMRWVAGVVGLAIGVSP